MSSDVDNVVVTACWNTSSTPIASIRASSHVDKGRITANLKHGSNSSTLLIGCCIEAVVSRYFHCKVDFFIIIGALKASVPIRIRSKPAYLVHRCVHSSHGIPFAKIGINLWWNQRRQTCHALEQGRALPLAIGACCRSNNDGKRSSNDLHAVRLQLMRLQLRLFPMYLVLLLTQVLAHFEYKYQPVSVYPYLVSTLVASSRLEFFNG